MDIYTALTITTIALAVLLVVGIGLFCFWFRLEKRLAKYGESKLYKTKDK